MSVIDALKGLFKKKTKSVAPVKAEDLLDFPESPSLDDITDEFVKKNKEKIPKYKFDMKDGKHRVFRPQTGCYHVISDSEYKQLSKEYKD